MKDETIIAGNWQLTTGNWQLTMWLDVRCIKDNFSEGRDKKGTATKVYYCKADAFVTADQALKASAGGVTVPERAEKYSDQRPYCTAREFSTDRLSPTQFNVTVTFSEPTGGAIGTIDDLLGKAAVITRSNEAFMEPYEKDRSSTPKIVRNAAGDRFDHMPERQDGHKIFNILKYVNAATKATIDAAWNTTNTAGVTIDGIPCAADTAWLFDCTFPPVDGAPGIFQATIVVKYKPGGWKDKPLSYGFRSLVGGVPKRIMETGEDGVSRPCSLPWPLDAAGAKKANQTDDPTEQTFVPYTSAAWTGVPLS